jgi:undecaprenyl diphosphate synthase
VTQSSFHVAIIMDGNGRWARRQHRPRVSGHRAGADAVRRVVRAAPGLGVGTLTLYAFSSDNWERPITEVTMLLRLFERYLRSETEELAANGVRLSVIGRRDRISAGLRTAIEGAEHATAAGDRLKLRIAIDYSARDAIVMAALRSRGLNGEPLDRDRFAWLLGEAIHDAGPTPDVDLVIRTGEEQRLSDFLLWECAYAELVFLRKMWPEFTGADLAAAVADFQMRERRFGRLPAAG